jgi:hypothetical protein
MYPSYALSRRVSPQRVKILLIGLFLALAWTSPAFSAPDKRADAEALTRSLVGLNTTYQKAAPAAKSKALQQLIDATVERQALLAELIKTDPGAMLRTAIPARIRNQMPAEVREFIEQRVDLEGELEVIYEDYADGSHRLRHTLKADGERISLHFKAQPPGLLSGTPAKIHGVLLGDAMAVESGEDDILTLALDGEADGGSNNGVSAPAPNTFGEQRTVVLLVNFQNDSFNTPWTVNETWNLVFDTVSGYFDENSYQQTWLSGDVFGWYTLPIDSTVCNSTQIASEARLAAENMGVDFTNYARFVYLFPRNSGCGWSGLGTVGGTPSESWINGKFKLGTIGHEFGHNFGLQHSHALECGNTTLGTDCASYEYGDHFDIMGNYTAGHLNAFQKAQLGWLGYGSSPLVTTVETAGSYALEPYESNGTGPKALKVLKGVDLITGTQSWYYLEYRQALGADAFLAGNSNILNGVVFHTGTDSDSRSSYQLDMTPASEVSGYYDWEDSALEQGRDYDDPESGANISTVFSNAEGATVEVRYGAPTCVRYSPALSFSPAQSDWVVPGTLVSYGVTVTNQDSLDCAASSFDLEVTPPANWTAAFSQTLPPLEPGTGATVTLEVTSSTNAVDGFYPVLISAANSTDGGFAVSDTVTYVVSLPPPANTAPSAVDDSVTLSAKDATVISVLANDTDADGDNLTIVAFMDGAKGTVADNGGGTLIYVPGKRFKTSDRFTYTISDGQDTATATVNITLDAQTGGGNKGGGKGGGKPKG